MTHQPKLYPKHQARKESTNAMRVTAVSARLLVLRQHEEYEEMLLHGKQQTACRSTQAREEARKLTRDATEDEIVASIGQIEDHFGKYYSATTKGKGLKVNPADEIFTLLKDTKVKIGELEEWASTIKKTEFPLGTGHFWQPLPNLPEANKILTQVIDSIKPTKAKASAFLAVKVTPLSEAEIMEAIALDFWNELPYAGKIEAWRMIPPPDQTAIIKRIGKGAPDKAKWDAIRDYHLETIRLAAAEANAAAS